MKLMITGGRGQLGQDLQKTCRRKGIDFQASDLPELDITDFRQIRKCLAAENPQAIVNCAAYNDVDRAESDYESASRVNGIGPKYLAIAAAQAGIPIMHFSSDFVFDGQKGSPYTVDDRPHPISRYGESKLLGEQEVQSTTDQHYLVRLSWVFGAGNVNFPKKVLEWAQNRQVLKVVDDQISCPSYTVDLAEFILDLLQTGRFGLYHMTNQGYCSRFEWARWILAKTMPKLRVEPASSQDFPTQARRPRFSALDPKPLNDVLGRGLPDWQDATGRFLEEIARCR